MTVVAWDGETLAADKRSIVNGTRRTLTKIIRHPTRPELLAITGCWTAGAEVRDWYVRGGQASEFPAAAREADNFARLVVVSPDGVKCFEGSPAPVVFDDTQAAFGSGADFALAAMYLGANAVRAVEVASRLSAECGDGVDTLTLVPTPHVVGEHESHPDQLAGIMDAMKRGEGI